MAEETNVPVCPTLLSQLGAQLKNPYVAFAIGVAASQGGSPLVDLVRTLIGL